MGNNGELLISSKDGVYRIKVSGRATFDCAPPLRDLARTLAGEKFDGIKIDLKSCEWMDSTFMGVLAMLGLRAKAVSAPMEICAADEQNKSLLAGLGLKKLFIFSENALEDEDSSADWKNGNQEVVKMAEGAQTVLEAHKTLMDVDEENVQKFETVVNLVQQDIDRMNGDNQ